MARTAGRRANVFRTENEQELLALLLAWFVYKDEVGPTSFRGAEIENKLRQLLEKAQREDTRYE